MRAYRSISPKEAEDYLDGAPFYCFSSNLQFMQYHPENSSLFVEYDALDGRGARRYTYDGVTRREMQFLIAAQSKGGAAHTLLIGRGAMRNKLKTYHKL